MQASSCGCTKTTSQAVLGGLDVQVSVGTAEFNSPQGSGLPITKIPVWPPGAKNILPLSKPPDCPLSPVLWLSPTTWSSSSLLLPHPKLPSDCLTIRLKAPSCQELSGLPLLYAILVWVTLACTHTHTHNSFILFCCCPKQVGPDPGTHTYLSRSLLNLSFPKPDLSDSSQVAVLKAVLYTLITGF